MSQFFYSPAIVRLADKVHRNIASFFGQNGYSLGHNVLAFDAAVQASGLDNTKCLAFGVWLRIAIYSIKVYTVENDIRGYSLTGFKVISNGS